MTKKFSFENTQLFNKIKIIANPARFKILEMTKEKPMAVCEIGDKLKIKYKRCSEYIRMMEEQGMVSKDKEGRNAMVRCNVKLSSNTLVFSV